MRRAAFAIAVVFAAGRLEADAARSGCKMNHLAKEKSPYLLQHVCNPVDWHPWSEAAFKKAREKGKPIFLSIGYSTCHWCHVMERESFSNVSTAKILNENYVPVKVDREERPDVDKIYMTAATGAGWGGGWPLNIWLTPDLKPFFGGTYFPPDSRWGRPGFPEILTKLAGLWNEKREDLDKSAEALAAGLRRYTKIEGRDAPLDESWLKKGFEAFRSGFNSVQGGFGGAPKFPMPVNQNFLLRYYARTGEKAALEMVETTLLEMAQGGIYDHIGGGFARYSVDDQWRVPHFEKMLYDNAQLAVNYIEAYQAGRNETMARVARETLEYVIRDMTHPEGGFYSAEDADSLPPELAAKGVSDEGHEHKSEGAFYLWTAKEIIDALGGETASMFNYRYGVRPDGNAYQDPHGEFTGKNILYEANTLEAAAKRANKSARQARREINEAREALLLLRAKRPRPGLDDKVLASWNGLMISAFAKGFQVLEEDRYREAAERAAKFLRDKLYDAAENRLYHRWRDGERKIAGMADDYAFLAQGLLDLYEATFDPQWLEWAEALTERLQSDFYDEGGGYYMTAAGQGKHLLVRVIEDSDNVEPNASSVAALNLLRLAQFRGRDAWREAAEKTLTRFGKQMGDHPRSLPQMLAAVGYATTKPRQIVIAGELGALETREMLRAVHADYNPDRILMVVTPSARERLAKTLPILKGMVPIKGQTTAYLCVNFACELPTTDLNKVRELLEKKGG